MTTPEEPREPIPPLDDLQFIDGIFWIEITRAGRLAGTGVRPIREKIKNGSMRSLPQGKEVWIPFSSVATLKRAGAALKSNKTKKLDYGLGKNKPLPMPGLSETPVLPMSSGRGGKGWIG